MSVRRYLVSIGDRFTTSVWATDARAAAETLAGYWRAQQWPARVVVATTGEVVSEDLWR